MANLDPQKPGEKSGKRKQKRDKKTEKKSKKSDQAVAAKELTDATIASEDTAETEMAVAAAETEAAVAATETEAAVAATEIEQTVEAMAPMEETEPMLVAAPAEPAAPPAMAERVASFKERMASVTPPADTAGKPPTPADIAQAAPSSTAAPVVGMQAIANAYRDYTRKSLEDAQSLAEKLSAARSLAKAVEAQTEFAQKACENFAADSRKIRELHRDLFWQTFRLPNWPLGKTR